jgi:hypothetical protein
MSGNWARPHLAKSPGGRALAAEKLQESPRWRDVAAAKRLRVSGGTVVAVAKCLESPGWWDGSCREAAGGLSPGF